MACSDQCYSNYCTGNRPSCATNRPISLSNASTGNIIKASDIELLRANTVAEIQTWNINPNYSFPISSVTGFTAGNIARAAPVNSLINDLNGTLHGNTPQISAGTIISAAKLGSQMLAIYNSLRTDCICNSDCGPHSVCSCHGDCGCNYSDERLKENIEYI